MNPERFGNYTLLRRLGKGGMAEVFLARAHSLGGFERLLAIKRLLPPYNTDDQIISMLADEARLSVWLDHPNIVQVLDFGRVGSTYFIAMEYVDGCDLCDLLRPNGEIPGHPLPLATALYVMVQAADALDHAHRRRSQKGALLKIIHRDVSPHNLLISREGQVKLADFGLARASISVHHSHVGVIRGKFSYMPIEQARGLDIDHRIDIFAAGVTMYEALTGVKPYTSGTLAHQLYQLEQPVPPPSAHVASIPEDIDEITMHAMSPDPETRYSSAEELSRDLRTALAAYSTFNQEAARLASLVQRMLGAKAAEPESLPPMSLAEFPVSEESLIGDELQQAQKATEIRNPPGADPHDGDDDDVATNALSRRPASPPSQQQTLEREPSPPAGPQAAIHGASAGPFGDRSRDAPVTEAAPKHAETAEEDDEDDEDVDLEADTIADDPLENARTTQRSPEEALAAFKRALEERERKRRSKRSRSPSGSAPRTPTRLDLQETLILAAGGLLLFGIGLATGWVLHRPPPAPTVTVVRALPGQGITVAPGPRPIAAARSRPDAGTAPVVTAVDSAVARTERPEGTGTPPSRTVKLRSASVSVSVSEKRPARGTGFLSVATSSPARVYIDDRTSSLPAPVERLALPPGVHRVRVFSEAKRVFSETKWITIQPGAEASVSFAIE